ncbi:hypothetical protein N7457_008309 [Penicillium paradoxum]|uniref:uncharacterized protein n=1 Tax=Penicillium paradoxum TaxID=176176 RepID=UPI002549051D|nr:uncharacterized protein N7457_008309 [Penicillium paradoxum]KAJ5773413.1 hypothetical protein N7457_008309 [Penicillium paradoxum]
MATPDRMMARPARSTILPVFPLELWDMIIESLCDEESAQHLSRLSRTCSMLYQRIEPSLYSTVRLWNSESGARLARTIERRPELAPRIRQIRHKEDAGSEFYSHRYLKFYKTAATLPELEKLVLRRNPRPFELTRWANRDERDDALLEWSRKVVTGTAIVKEWRDLGWGPPGESSFSPPGVSDKLSFERDSSKEGLFSHALLQNPPGMPALRVCHIGSDYNGDQHNTQMDSGCLPSFTEALFRHPGLRQLCVTGAFFQISTSRPSPSAMASTQLEELTLLNCKIDPSDLGGLLEYPQALKRFTFRGPRIEDLVDPEGQPRGYVESVLAQARSLEFMDYDLYWGGDEDADFGELTNLKHLTTTLSTLAGKDCLELNAEDDILPSSLESLTIRYDEVKAWLPSSIHEMLQSGMLPNLRRFTCEVPEIIEDLPSINESKTNPPATQICQEINIWKSRFETKKVELSAVTVPYPLVLPKYKTCSCECLSFYHRMFFHLHDPLSHPFDFTGEDVFYDDWADIDDELDLDQIMDDIAEGSGSDFMD